jgi:hypothetical protein
MKESGSLVTIGMPLYNATRYLCGALDENVAHWPGARLKMIRANYLD